MTLDFWRFAYERQAIWHRRFVEGLPAPWTDDPVLAGNWFVNVHRELDPGTITLRRDVIGRTGATVEELLWNTLLYRAFNNRRAWEECVRFVPAPFDLAEPAACLAARHARGDTIWTRAWTTSPLTNYPGRTRLERVVNAAGRWDVARLRDRLRNCRGLEDVWETLRREPLMGKFTGFQVALDLTYFPGSRFTDDEWVYTYSSEGKLAKADYLPAGSRSGLDAAGAGSIVELRDRQDEELAARGLRWADVAWDEKPRLTLADVEHTLCEWDKYLKLVAGHNGRVRRYPPVGREAA